MFRKYDGEEQIEIRHSHIQTGIRKLNNNALVKSTSFSKEDVKNVSTRNICALQTEFLLNIIHEFS